MHHPPQSLTSPSVSLPLKFAGGFGIDSRRIGAMFTVFAISSTLCQFFLFPPLARRLGVLTCLRIAFHVFPLVFLITPFTSLIADPTTKQIAVVALLIIRGICGTFAFPTSTIMLTNSASSLRVLGTINGLATTVSAIGRAAGPAISGGLFTWGVKRGYLIVPFWTLAGIAVLAAVPTWWLIEGEGFGDDDDEQGTETNEAGTDVATPNLAAASPRPMTFSDHDAESEFGDFGPEIASYTSTRRSSEAVSFEHSEVGADELESGRRRRHSGVRRRSSVPIGMGCGFRRYSSNLGSTGVGAPGTSWGGT
jgi:hypothetical protein